MTESWRFFSSLVLNVIFSPYYFLAVFFLCSRYVKHAHYTYTEAIPERGEHSVPEDWFITQSWRFPGQLQPAWATGWKWLLGVCTNKHANTHKLQTVHECMSDSSSVGSDNLSPVKQGPRSPNWVITRRLTCRETHHACLISAFSWGRIRRQMD